MKNIIKSIIIIFFFNSCSAQEKETVYLIFKPGEMGNCNLSAYRDGRNEKEITFKFWKNEYKDGKITFEICRQYFNYERKNNLEEVSKKDNLNIVDINYLLDKWQNNPVTFNKNTAFKNIFILIETNQGTFMRYEVSWVDLNLNKDK